MTRIFQKKYLIYWIMALAVVARVIALGKSFQGDEYFSVIDARSLASIPDALLSDTHPPLYFYILHFFMKISMQEAFLRVLSIIPGLGICFLTYLIGKDFLDEASGWIGSLIVALAPIAVWSSQYVRTYSLAAFFTVFSVYFLVRVLTREDKDLKGWAGYVACSALSMYTFYFSALIILAENVYVFLFARKKQFINKWIFAQIAIATAYIPWMPYFMFQRSSYVGHPQMVERVGFYIGNIHVGALIRSVAGLFGFDPRLFSKDAMSAQGLVKIAGILGGVAILALIVWSGMNYYRTKKTNKKKDRVVILLVSLALVPFLIAVILHQIFGIILMSHYFIASFVFLALFMSVVIVHSMTKKMQLAVLACLAIAYCARLGSMYQDKEMDFKGAYRYVKSVVAAGDSVISPSFGGMFDYYFADLPNRISMEDRGSFSRMGNYIVAVTYPGKLELKDEHKNFRVYLSSHNYKLKSSETFGDLIVERYTRS